MNITIKQIEEVLYKRLDCVYCDSCKYEVDFGKDNTPCEDCTRKKWGGAYQN